MTVLLELRELHCGYGRIPILDGIRLGVGAGELLGVLGHNGMGKTTLMRAIIGELSLTQGSVHFGAMDITHLPTHQRARLGIGYVPQGRMIFPSLTVHDNLRFAARASGADHNVVEQVLAELPMLERLLERQGGLLSGGEQQILALARCLCTQPRLLLLDEPTEGIQPSIVEQMIDLLRRLHRSRDLTIVLVEQNLDFVRALAQRIAVLEKGRIRQIVGTGDADATTTLLGLTGFSQE